MVSPDELPTVNEELADFTRRVVLLIRVTQHELNSMHC
jgi:hypothetical protein